jgi:hypothetical protein
MWTFDMFVQIFIEIDQKILIIFMLSVETCDKQIGRHAELTKRELCVNCVLDKALLFAAIN